MPNSPRYDGWKSVPPNLLTKTQLGELDMPRIPAPEQEPAGTVRTFNYRGRSDEFDLYDVAETAPSTATAHKLAASRTPAADTRHLCVDCGARTERPCALREAHARRLCEACAHIADLAAAQIRLRAARAEHAAWAAGIVADPHVRYVHIRSVHGPAPDEGKRPPLLAVHITIADHDGATVLETDVSARVNGILKAAPAGTIRWETGATQVADTLRGHRVVCWSQGHALQLRKLLARTDATPEHIDAVDEKAAQWRGDVSPTSGALRSATDPGRADRLWLVIARMGATPIPAAEAFTGVDERLRADPRAAHLHLITHHEATAERIESLFRMLDVAAGPATITRGTASRRVPGATEMHLPIHLDGMPGHDGE